MTALGYFRKLEKLLTLMRDQITPEANSDPKVLSALEAAADAVDQSWADLSKDDQLMVYNMARHLCDNIKPVEKPAESKPLIQLLH